MSDKFLYFAYGSNLCEEVIHVSSPSAVRIGPAKLKDYKLTFATFSKRWQGASATLIRSPESYVWGALWEIGNADLENLYRQEGVNADIYEVINSEVELTDGSKKECRFFIQKLEPALIEDMKELPDERKPSAVYINKIINGAQESGLPEEYINFLKEVPHNEYDGEPDLTLNLDA